MIFFKICIEKFSRQKIFSNFKFSLPLFLAQLRLTSIRFEYVCISPSSFAKLLTVLTFVIASVALSDAEARAS